MRLYERVRNWAKTLMLCALAAFMILGAINYGASFFTDVSHSTETIRALTPSITKIIGAQ